MAVVIDSYKRLRSPLHSGGLLFFTKIKYKNYFEILVSYLFLTHSMTKECVNNLKYNKYDKQRRTPRGHIIGLL